MCVYIYIYVDVYIYIYVCIYIYIHINTNTNDDNTNNDDTVVIRFMPRPVYHSAAKEVRMLSRLLICCI